MPGALHASAWAIAALILIPSAGWTQTPEPARTDSLRQDLGRLSARLDSLERGQCPGRDSVVPRHKRPPSTVRTRCPRRWSSSLPGSTSSSRPVAHRVRRCRPRPRTPRTTSRHFGRPPRPRPVGPTRPRAPHPSVRRRRRRVRAAPTCSIPRSAPRVTSDWWCGTRVRRPTTRSRASSSSPSNPISIRTPRPRSSSPSSRKRSASRRDTSTTPVCPGKSGPTWASSASRSVT